MATGPNSEVTIIQVDASDDPGREDGDPQGGDSQLNSDDVVESARQAARAALTRMRARIRDQNGTGVQVGNGSEPEMRTTAVATGGGSTRPAAGGQTTNQAAGAATGLASPVSVREQLRTGQHSRFRAAINRLRTRGGELAGVIRQPGRFQRDIARQLLEALRIEIMNAQERLFARYLGRRIGQRAGSSASAAASAAASASASANAAAQSASDGDDEEDPLAQMAAVLGVGDSTGAGRRSGRPGTARGGRGSAGNGLATEDHDAGGAAISSGLAPGGSGAAASDGAAGASSRGTAAAPPGSAPRPPPPRGSNPRRAIPPPPPFGAPRSGTRQAQPFGEVVPSDVLQVAQLEARKRVSGSSAAVQAIGLAAAD